MDIQAIVNSQAQTEIYSSPSAERFYRQQTQRNTRRQALQELRPTQINTTHRSSELTRDDKVAIRAVREVTGWDYHTIARKFNGKYTDRQIQLAIAGPLTPRKSTSHKSRILINTPLRERIRRFLDEKREHRDIPWPDLRWLVPGLETYGDQAIHSAMKRLGYNRVLKPRVIKLTARAKRLRVAFANWALERWPNPEDWVQDDAPNILFSDETWATNNPMWKRWITVHDTEDPETWALLRQKGHGWMFWGSFTGRKKGPCFFWEKEMGSITSDKYCEHILPRVERFLRPYVDCWFQHDGASSHTALYTQMMLAELRIQVVKWPPTSPDLNPIENVWHWMKNWIELHYDIQSLNMVHLRSAILAAWQAVPEDFLESLARSMPDRLRKVVLSGGDKVNY